MAAIRLDIVLGNGQQVTADATNLIKGIDTVVQNGMKMVVEQGFRPIATELTKLTTLVREFGDSFKNLQPQTASLSQINNLLKQISENAAKAGRQVKTIGGAELSALTGDLSQKSFTRYVGPEGDYRYTRGFGGIDAQGVVRNLSVTYNKDDEALRARITERDAQQSQRRYATDEFGGRGLRVATGPEASGMVSDELSRARRQGDLQHQKELESSIRGLSEESAKASHPIRGIAENLRAIGRTAIYFSAITYSVERLGGMLRSVFAGPIEKVIEATTDQRKFEIGLSGLVGTSSAASIDRSLISNINNVPISLDEQRQMVLGMTKVAPTALSMMGNAPGTISGYQNTIASLQAMNPQSSTEEILRGVEGALLGQGRALRTVVQIDPQQLAQLVGRSGQNAFRGDPQGLLTALNRYVNIFGPEGGAASLNNMPGMQFQHIKDQLSAALSDVGNSGVFSAVTDEMKKTADALAQYFSTDADWAKHAESIGHSMSMIIRSVGDSLLTFMDHATGVKDHANSVEGAVNAVDLYFQRLASLGNVMHNAAAVLGSAVNGIAAALDGLIRMIAGNVGTLEEMDAHHRQNWTVSGNDKALPMTQAFAGMMSNLTGKDTADIAMLLQQGTPNWVNTGHGNVNLSHPNAESEFVYQAFMQVANRRQLAIGPDGKPLPSFASPYLAEQDIRAMAPKYGQSLTPDWHQTLTQMNLRDVGLWSPDATSQSGGSGVMSLLSSAGAGISGYAKSLMRSNLLRQRGVQSELEAILNVNKNGGGAIDDFFSRTSDLTGVSPDVIQKALSRLLSDTNKGAGDIQKFGLEEFGGINQPLVGNLFQQGRYQSSIDSYRSRLSTFQQTSNATGLDHETLEQTKSDIAELTEKIAELQLKSNEFASSMKTMGDSIQHTIGSGVGKFFTDVELGTKNASQAFRDMGRQILSTVNDTFSHLLVNQLFGNLIGAAGGSPYGNTMGGGLASLAIKGAMGLFGPPSLMNYNNSAPIDAGVASAVTASLNAEGGVFGSPHLGVIGEGGMPEAVVPMPHGYIPVSLDGQHAMLPGGGRVPIGPSGRHADGGIFGSRISGAGSISTPYGPNASSPGGNHEVRVYNVFDKNELAMYGFDATKNHILNLVGKESRPGGKLSGAGRRT